MNKIQEVKERADIVKVAEYFGIQLNRNYKAKCLFHKEDTASLSINTDKQIWKCFGCNLGGDAISLVQELLNINAYEASKQVNDICNCGVDFNSKTSKLEIEKYKQKQKVKQEFDTWIGNAYDILTTYYKQLISYTYIEDLEDVRLIEALQNIDKIEYYIDYLFNSTEEEKILFWKYNKKVVIEVDRRLRTRIT